MPPAQLAMAILLQAYTGSSDAEAIENAVVDARWRMVLGVLGPEEEEPPFSQGTLQRFRQRLIAHDLDRRLLERTVELAKKTRGFDFKKLPKTVRLAVDSRPLTGAGRVEDTFNLLGHAARKLLRCAAAIAEIDPRELAESIDAPALTASSTKRGLDIDWNDPDQKAGAIKKLVAQIDRLEAWVQERLGEAAQSPPLSEQLATLAQLREQDLEPDPGGGGPRIRDGVAPDRRISIEDPDMRHGRKSKSQTIKGYKTHLGADLDTNLIVACAVTPANKPEAEALPAIVEDLARYRERNAIGSLHIDRGYLASAAVRSLTNRGIPIVSKPWRPQASSLFAKSDFKLNLGRFTITCPAGKTEKIQLGAVVQFPAETCDACPMRAQCTDAAPGRGRTVTIAPEGVFREGLRGPHRGDDHRVGDAAPQLEGVARAPKDHDGVLPRDARRAQDGVRVLDAVAVRVDRQREEAIARGMRVDRHACGPQRERHRGRGRIDQRELRPAQLPERPGDPEVRVVELSGDAIDRVSLAVRRGLGLPTAAD